MTIELPADVQRRLAREAERHGIPQNEYAVRLIEKALPEAAAPPTPTEQPSAALFAQWAEEDAERLATMTPEAVAAEDDQWDEIMTNLQANRLTLPVPDVSGHD